MYLLNPSECIRGTFSAIFITSVKTYDGYNKVWFWNKAAAIAFNAALTIETVRLQAPSQPTPVSLPISSKITKDPKTTNA